MWTLKNNDVHVDELLSIYQWLQVTSHAESLPEGEFFVISTTLYEFENVGDYMVYGADDVYIYVFDSMDSYKEFINQ